MSELIEVKTIAEVERIVHGSGLWDGTGPVEFSNDGETWAETWTPTTEHPFPEFARVEVYRKDVRIPTKVTIRWDEQVPRADEFWAAKWFSSPMRHFGRTVRMVGFRQTFRELLGNIVLEDEDRAGRTETVAPGTEPAPARDWAAEIAAASSAEVLNAIDRDARAARIFTPDAAGTALHRALKDRRRALTDAAWAPTPTAAPKAIEFRTASGAPRTTEPKPGRPQDFLAPAGNRAVRRKAARKKGGKR